MTGTASTWLRRGRDASGPRWFLVSSATATLDAIAGLAPGMQPIEHGDRLSVRARDRWWFGTVELDDDPASLRLANMHGDQAGELLELSDGMDAAAWAGSDDDDDDPPEDACPVCGESLAFGCACERNEPDEPDEPAEPAELVDERRPLTDRERAALGALAASLEAAIAVVDLSRGRGNHAERSLIETCAMKLRKVRRNVLRRMRRGTPLELFDAPAPERDS